MYLILCLVLRYSKEILFVLKSIQPDREISNYSNVWIVLSYWPCPHQFRNDHNLGNDWYKDCICNRLENMPLKQTKREKMKALTIPLPKNTNDFKDYKSIHWQDITVKAESHFGEQIIYQSTPLRRATLWLQCGHLSWGDGTHRKEKCTESTEVNSNTIGTMSEAQKGPNK